MTRLCVTKALKGFNGPETLRLYPGCRGKPLRRSMIFKLIRETVSVIAVIIGRRPAALARLILCFNLQVDTAENKNTSEVHGTPKELPTIDCRAN